MRPCLRASARLIQTPVPHPRPIAFLDARLIDPAAMRESRGGALVVDKRLSSANKGRLDRRRIS